MNNTKRTIQVIIYQGILPLYYNADETVSIEILRTMYRTGVRALEYTNRGEAALSNFKKMLEIREAELPGMLLGIGTIKNLQIAEEYIAAGADFLVSPGFVHEVAVFAMEKDFFYAPGCMTPTEIIDAENAGVSFIKLFPGNLLGTDFLKSIKDLFPHLYFMPTGGVDTTKENIKTWFDAGVCAVGMGSKLISKELMQQRDYNTLEKETIRVLDLIKVIRK